MLCKATLSKTKISSDQSNQSEERGDLKWQGGRTSDPCDEPAFNCYLPIDIDGVSQKEMLENLYPWSVLMALSNERSISTIDYPYVEPIWRYINFNQMQHGWIFY